MCGVHSKDAAKVDIRIVLVDNGSGNGSEESLREEFAGEKECM